MHHDLVMFGIISILIFLAPLITRITKLPLVVIQMLLGAFAINSGILEHSVAVKEVSRIGFLFLMFLAGIEVDLKGFIALGASFSKRVLLYFFVLYTATIIAVSILKLPVIYVAAFPVMSLGMIMALLKDYGKKEVWLNLALKIGIIGELISISALVMLDGYYSFGIGFELYKTLGILVVFLGLVVIAFRFFSIIFWWFPFLRLVLIPKNGTMNQDIRYSMMMFFAMIVIVSMLRIEAALGAFLAGMVLSSFFRYQKELTEKLSDFGFGFLVPLFFTYIGSTLDFESIFRDKEIVIRALVMCGAMITVRIIATSTVFYGVLKSTRNIILFALSDSMPLTFLVATATLGVNIGALTKYEYFSFVLAAMFEGIVFTILIKIIFTLTKHKTYITNIEEKNGKIKSKTPISLQVK